MAYGRRKPALSGGRDGFRITRLICVSDRAAARPLQMIR
jgi:hypothetical protein